MAGLRLPFTYTTSLDHMAAGIVTPGMRVSAQVSGVWVTS